MSRENSSGAGSPAPTERWASRLGVILAVSGSAVGLGNFLRFPGQAVANGGGAFMIPYFCALLLVGIPIGWAEWAMGRYGGRRGFHSAPAIMGVLGRGSVARYFGVLGLLIPLVVYMYYILIESWCLRYAYDYLVGNMDLGADAAKHTEASGALFAAATGVQENGFLAGDSFQPIIFWAIVFAINTWLVYRGLSAGIEWFCRWAMPAMAVCAVIVLVRVLTLGTPNPALPEQNVINGLGYMWNPQPEKLLDFNTWLAAAGQVFFSLSVGFGVILNYASYIGRNDDVMLSGMTASATNEVFEVGFGGLITVTAAFVFLGASGAMGGTFGLGFNVLPVVFQQMGPAGRWIGAIWFFMLFLAAITSSLSMLQPVRAFLEEALGLPRRGAVALLVAISAAGSLYVIYFSKGLTALDTMDFWVGTFAILLLALAQIVVFGWVFGIQRGIEEANRGATVRLPRFMGFVMKYVSPVYLLVVFAGFCLQNLGGYIKGLRENPVATATMGVIFATFIMLVIMTRIGEKRWRAAGLDLDGQRDRIGDAR
jgi:NSS family neurotransmitter:Na+ symporter